MASKTEASPDNLGPADLHVELDHYSEDRPKPISTFHQTCLIRAISVTHDPSV